MVTECMLSLMFGYFPKWYDNFPFSDSFARFFCDLYDDPSYYNSFFPKKDGREEKKKAREWKVGLEERLDSFSKSLDGYRIKEIRILDMDEIARSGQLEGVRFAIFVLGSRRRHVAFEPPQDVVVKISLIPYEVGNGDRFNHLNNYSNWCFLESGALFCKQHPDPEFNNKEIISIR